MFYNFMVSNYSLIRNDWIKLKVIEILKENEKISPEKISKLIPKYQSRNIAHRTTKRSLLFLEILGIVEKEVIEFSAKKIIELYHLTTLGKKIFDEKIKDMILT